jgi:DNA-directed RNA polymerase subunit E'/Rpb7
MSYKTEQLLTSTLILNPRDLKNEIDNVIKMKIKETLEGRSYEDGYIIKDTIRIIQRSLGSIVTNNKKSEIKYTIKYKADVISPNVNDEINIIVNSINKMGIIGYIKIKESDTFNDSPLIIMVPKEYFAGSTINYEDVLIGQKIDVITVGTRTKYNTKNIQVIARPV